MRCSGGLRQPVIRVASCRRKRPSHQIAPTIATSATASSTANSNGWVHDSHSAVGTAASPSRDMPTFENGSGEVLTAARVVALATWLVAASVPPISAAAIVQTVGSAPNTAAASAAPAGMRTSVCTRSHRESMPGILSAKNSTNSIKPLAVSISGCCNTVRPPGSSTQPRRPAMPVRNTTAYRRRPLAQPSAAAIASSWGVSSGGITIVNAARRAGRAGVRRP